MKSIVVELCAGTACHVMGANALTMLLQSLSTAQKEHIQVKLTHCLGNCGQGPNVRVDGHLYSRVNAERLREIVKQHCEQE